MKSRWITHKGRRIFITDLSGLGFDLATLQTELEAVAQTVKIEPLGSLLAVTNVQGLRVTPQTLTLLKDALAHTTPYVHKRAVIGLTPTHEKVLGVINAVTGRKPFTVFHTLEQAQDWLIET